MSEPAEATDDTLLSDKGGGHATNLRGAWDRELVLATCHWNYEKPNEIMNAEEYTIHSSMPHGADSEMADENLPGKTHLVYVNRDVEKTKLVSTTFLGGYFTP